MKHVTGQPEKYSAGVRFKCGPPKNSTKWSTVFMIYTSRDHAEEEDCKRPLIFSEISAIFHCLLCLSKTWPVVWILGASVKIQPNVQSISFSVKALLICFGRWELVFLVCTRCISNIILLFILYWISIQMKILPYGLLKNSPGLWRTTPLSYTIRVAIESVYFKRWWSGKIIIV